MLRTHTCGQLRAGDIGQTVTLCGWVDSYRDHKGVLFVDLRDRYGKTQVVVGPDSGAVNPGVGSGRAQRMGDSGHRPSGQPARGNANPKLATGEIELRTERLEVLNKSLTPPFQPGGTRNCPARISGSSIAISTCAGRRCSR